MLPDPVLFTLGSLTADSLVRDVEDLPPAPRVLPRLRRLLLDANSSLQEVVAFIRLDPAIAGRVLRMGNSAYFSHGVRCRTVAEAIHRVGYDEIYQLVSLAVTSDVLARPLETYGLEADGMWRHSVACALAAELLADRCHEDREVSYTVGLLHAVGMIAIDNWAGRRRSELRLTSKGFPREASDNERLCLGFTQADAGSALLQYWEFPREMYDPVRYQYTPRACASDPRITCLLHCAKWMAGVVCSPADARLPQPLSSIRQMLGLSADSLVRLVDDLLRRMREVSSILDIEPSTRVDLPLMNRAGGSLNRAPGASLKV